MSDTFSREDILGTLPNQIRRAETFLVDHLRKGVQLKDTMARKESFEYPMEAARELVVNAVAHRDYSIAGDNIRLFIFRDHMEVNSPGGLPGPVTVANIKDERYSRNPIIVQVLSDMGFIERLGYGVDRVIELMRQQDLRAPEFTETAGGFRVVLYNHDYQQVAQTDSETQAVAERVAPTEILSEYQGIPINPRQEAAIVHLSKPGTTRITNSELQRLYPDVHAETIRRDLADLVTKNILSKMGQKRGSYYVLRRDHDTAED
jgi:ATP-dependent DNA helicase RecG